MKIQTLIKLLQTFEALYPEIVVKTLQYDEESGDEFFSGPLTGIQFYESDGEPVLVLR